MDDQTWRAEREKLRRPCGHFKCDPDKCFALTDEQLTPDADDLAFAQKLIDDGWLSTSNKYRAVSRVVLPNFEEMIKPEYLNTWFIKDIYHHMQFWQRHHFRGQHAEHLELTVRQFRAFKQLGGHTA